MPIVPAEIAFKNIEIGNARGDSMAPTISPGDLLFLDKTVTYFDGDGIYICL
ncbi:hypothetical protein BHJ80_16115 [Escherichia coli]|nr:hypothetical protein BHJ80_16115 [Escherichia coli]